MPSGYGFHLIELVSEVGGMPECDWIISIMYKSFLHIELCAFSITDPS